MKRARNSREPTLTFLLLAAVVVWPPVPAVAGETALQALLREDPNAADYTSLGWLEREVLTVLTPEQHAAFVGGADASSLVLASDETLADFVLRQLSIRIVGGIRADNTMSTDTPSINAPDGMGDANECAVIPDDNGIILCSEDKAAGAVATVGDHPVSGNPGPSSEKHSGVGNFGVIGDRRVEVRDPDVKLRVAGVIHSELGGFRFPDGSVQSTAAGNAALDCTTLIQPYSGTVELSCPSGYVAVLASCNLGFNVVLHGQFPDPPSGFWVWYLIPDVDSATGVHCELSPGSSSQIHLRCCR